MKIVCLNKQVAMPHRVVFCLLAWMVVVTPVEILWAKPNYSPAHYDKVSPINFGPAGPADLTTYFNRFYFSGEAGGDGRELWQYNYVTAAQATDIYNGPTSSNPTDFLVHDIHLYFNASSYDGGSSSYTDTLHRYFSGGLAEEVDGNYPKGYKHLTHYDNQIYFQADGPKGKELYRFSGEAHSGVKLVSDINDFGDGSGGSSPSDLTTLGDTLFFTADKGYGRQLYFYNAATPNQVGNYLQYDQVQDLAVYGNQLYFSAQSNTGNNVGQELYRIQGGSIQLVDDIRQGSNSSSPRELTVADGKLYFSGSLEPNKRGLYQYDGANVTLTPDIWPGGEANPTDLAVLKDQLYFSAVDETNGRELFHFNGTQSVPLTNINPGTNGGHAIPQNMLAHKGQLYFAASEDGTNFSLWRYKPAVLADLGFSITDGASLYQFGDPGNGASQSEGASGETLRSLARYGEDLLAAAVAGPAPGIEVFRHDGTPDSFVSTAGIPLSITASANDPRILYYVDQESGWVYQIDPDTGTETVAYESAYANPGPLTARADGQLYLAWGGTGNFASHQLTRLSDGQTVFETDGMIQALTADDRGNLFLITDQQQLWRVDLEGEVTPLWQDHDLEVYGLDYDPVGDTFYSLAADGESLNVYTLAREGQASLFLESVTGLPGDLTGVDFRVLAQVIAIPEPSMVALLGLGFLALLRRNKRTQGGPRTSRD